MSKRRSRNRKAPGAEASNKQRTAVAMLLVLAFIAGTIVLAQVATKSEKKNQPSDFTTQNLQASGPAKEYIYAGTKLVATVEPTAVVKGAVVNDAEYVSMVMDPQVFGDAQSHPVSVTMRNTGTTTWTAGAGYKLGAQNPASNNNWGLTRAPLPNSVAPGSTVTFTFGATKTTSVGTGYINFQWQMVQDGGAGFFGEKTQNRLVQAGAWLPGSVPNNASYVAQSVPSFMLSGQTYPVSVTMTNTGTNTWTSASNYKLGSQIPQDNTYWGTNRIALPASTPQGANATFSFNATAPSTPGIYNFQWMMVQDGGAGFFGNLSQAVLMTVTSKAAMGYLDYDLDGKTDLAIWRPGSLQLLIDTNLNGSADLTYTYGTASTDIPLPGDYNGDGKGDLASLKPSANKWSFDFNRDGTVEQFVIFGASGDVPTPQDYNGDLQSDIAVFRPSTGQWLVDTNRNGAADLTVSFGQNSDIPVPADYDGDAIADLALFRPSIGQWLIDTNRDGAADLTISLGQSGDIPVAMDFNGDGKADLAVFKNSGTQWLIDTNRDGTSDISITFGLTGDIPVAGDYNGDGKADAAMFRPSNQKWYIDTNLNGTADYTITMGGADNPPRQPLRQNGWILKAMGILPL